MSGGEALKENQNCEEMEREREGEDEERVREGESGKDGGKLGGSGEGRHSNNLALEGPPQTGGELEQGEGEGEREREKERREEEEENDDGEDYLSDVGSQGVELRPLLSPVTKL